MANVNKPKQPKLPAHLEADATTIIGSVAMIGSLLGGLGLIANAGWAGAGLLLFAVAAFVLAGLAAASTKDQKVEFPEMLVMLSAAAAIWAPLLLSASHILPFSIAGWAAEALFVAGIVLGVRDKLKGIGKFIAALLGLSLAVCLIFLPSPKAFDDPSKEENKWRVGLSVRDDHGEPVSNALGQCAVVAPWDAKPTALDPAQARRSDAEGKFEPWEFVEDPKMKTVFCFAVKEAAEDNAGYPARPGFAAHLVRGVTEPVVIELTESPHPDTAFVVVDAEVVISGAWAQLSLELWNGEPVLDGSESNLIKRKNWNLHLDGGFELEAAAAETDLYIRSVYQDESSSSVKMFHIGPVIAGGRRKVSIKVN